MYRESPSGFSLILSKKPNGISIALYQILIMKFLSVEAFVPSGADMNASKQLFIDLGFTINWDAGDYVGFQKDGAKFILQNFNKKDFAENLMLTIQVDSVEEVLRSVSEKQLTKKYNVRFSDIQLQPYGKEVNMIDLAGVCWHFVEP
jgi:hypothetical protein